MSIAQDAVAARSATRAIARSARNAALWLVILRVALLAVGFVQTMLLARLLTPTDFGLMGVCLLTMAFLDVLSQTGFVQALIHEREVGAAELNTSWTFGIGRGVVLGVATVLLASPVASFFGEPQVADLQRVLGVVFVLDGLTNPAMVLFRKELTFARTVAHQLSGTLTEAAVGLSLAFATHSVWALVAARLARYAMLLGASYLLSSYRPRIHFDRSVFRRLRRYGRWVTLTGILVLLLNQGDDAVVGRLSGVQALGLYQLAFLLSNMPATEVTNMVGQIAFPAYVKLRDAGESVGKAFIHVLQLVMFFSIPLAGAVFAIGPDVVRALLAPKWHPMIPALQILAIWGMIRSIGANSGPLFQSLGRPDLAAKTSLLRFVVMAAIIVPTTREWGITGAAAAVLGAACVAAPLTYTLSIRLAACSVGEATRAVLVPLANTLAAVAVLIAFHEVVADTARVHWIAIQIALGLTVYAAMVVAWVRWGGYAGDSAFSHLRSAYLRRRLAAETL